MQKMQVSDETPEFLLSDEVMERARISRRTLDRWVAEGILPAYQVSRRTVRRYLRTDVEAVIRGEHADVSRDSDAEVARISAERSPEVVS